MREIERLKEQILKEYPRLTEESTFNFACHKNVPCFNACCADVNIFLTPYDIIRLKKGLGLSSTEILKKYTIAPFDKNLKYPVILLKMNDDEKKSCPFVTEAGCSVYENRPWACRMYPIGLASPGEKSGELDREFYFLLKEDICQGFRENRKYSVREWLQDQGINEYNEMGRYFKDITTHEFFQKEGNLSPQKMEMFFIASYDVDRFRRFIFESSFLDKFNLDQELQERIKADDVELMKFSMNWLRFAMFGEKSVDVKDDVLKSKKKELAEKAAREKK